MAPFQRAAPFSPPAPSFPEDAPSDARERWYLAGMRVRLCVFPDEPRLIDGYLALGQRLQALPDHSAWDVALESAWLLLRTAADVALPMHWRCVCLDALHRPMSVLDSLCRDERQRQERAALMWTLARLSLEGAQDVHPGQDAEAARPRSSFISH